jgi:hypothetical protein
MAKARSGGGITSNKLVHKPVRTGAERRHVHPGGVGQLGQRQGDHTTDGKATGYRGQPLFGPNKPISVPLGNELATNVGKGGPGTGRKIYACGTQGTQGEVNRGSPMPVGEIFPGFKK